MSGGKPNLTGWNDLTSVAVENDKVLVTINVDDREGMWVNLRAFADPTYELECVRIPDEMAIRFMNRLKDRFEPHTTRGNSSGPEHPPSLVADAEVHRPATGAATPGMEGGHGFESRP